jgi:hypothetical protein
MGEYDHSTQIQRMLYVVSFNDGPQVGILVKHPTSQAAQTIKGTLDELITDADIASL